MWRLLQLCISKLLQINAVACECGGSFSCYGVSMINMTTSNFYLTCSGLYSCADVSNIGHYSSQLVTFGYFGCVGELSCSGSTFTNVTSLVNFLCDGDRACLNSNITLNGATVSVQGYLGAANSTIKIAQRYNNLAF